MVRVDARLYPKSLLSLMQVNGIADNQYYMVSGVIP
jgi:hypothetical protein